MDKHLTHDEQARLAAADLSEAEALSLREHLLDCRGCAREAAVYESAAAFLRERPRAVLPAHFAARLRVRLAELKLRQPSQRQIRASRIRLALGLTGCALAAVMLVALMVSHAHRRSAEPSAPAQVASGPRTPRVGASEGPPGRLRQPAAEIRPAGVVASKLGPSPPSASTSQHNRQRQVAAARRQKPRDRRHEMAPGDVRSAATHDEAPKLARIVSVKGAPTVLGGDAKRQWVASPNSGLRVGEGLRGGEADRALVRWDDGSEIATDYNTAVRVLRDGGNDSAHLRLEQGRLWVWAPGDGSGVKIETPAGVAEIKHGEAIVGIGFLLQPGIADAATVVTAFSGQSAFLTRSRQTAIAPGQAVRAWAEQKVEDPRPIVAPEMLRRGLLWGSEYHIWREWGPGIGEVLSLLAAPRAALGIEPAPRPAPGGGLTVYRTRANTPAARAGVQPGDVLQSLNDQALWSPSDLPAWELLAVERCPASATVRRGNEPLTLRLDCFPEPPTIPWPQPVTRILNESVVSLAAGDLAAAKMKLRQVLNRDRNCAAAYYNLGLIFAHEGRWPEAVEACHRAAELAPEVGVVRRLYGRSLLAIANLEAAARELRRTLELQDNDIAARYLLGRTLLVGGDPAAAAVEAQRLLTRSDGISLGERLLGDMAAIGGQHREAVAHCRKALQADAYDLGAKTLLALELNAGGDYDGAEREARELLTWDPTSFRAANLIGAIHLRARDYPLAEEWLQRARILRPDFSYAYSNLGGLYLCMRDYVQSEASYRQAVQISGEVPATHIGLAMLLQTVGREREAEQEYLLALDLDPSNRQALTELVALCRATGREKRAAMFLTRYDLSGS